MKKGFTLIELVLILTLLGILGVLGGYITSIRDMREVSIDAASRKIQADIRYAQHLAVIIGTNHGVSFTDDGGYEVYQGNPGNPVLDPVTRANFVIDMSDFNGVSIDGNYQVEFDLTGDPVLGGNDGVELETTGGREKEIYVYDVTGAVQITSDD